METLVNKSDIITLKEYVDKLMNEVESKSNVKIEAVEAKSDLKINAVRETITLSQSTLNERLAKMNEIREIMRDQSLSYMTKNEHELYMKRIDDKFDKLCQDLLNLKDGDIADLKKNRDENQGKASQNSVIIAYAIAGISIALTIAKFFIH